MTAAAHGYALEPRFLRGTADYVFVLGYRPSRPTGRGVILCPPFAEEMNKSRKMFALTAQKLAAMGAHVLIVDLFGTGDSRGNFCEARWQIWKDDILAGLQWLSEAGCSGISIIGLRLGATLAVELSATDECPVDRLFLWQPVVSGSNFMTQFLRLKVAAQMKPGDKPITTGELRGRAEAGQCIEVAGYSVAPELLRSIDALDLRRLEPPGDISIAWLEVVSGARTDLNNLSAKVVDSWRTAELEVSARTIQGDAFWSAPEVTVAPALIDTTVELYEQQS